jgi:Calcium binding
MAPEEECESEMFVWVRHAGARIAVPLAQLQPISKDHDTREAVGDWLYWVDRGYEL